MHEILLEVSKTREFILFFEKEDASPFLRNNNNQLLY